MCLPLLLRMIRMVSNRRKVIREGGWATEQRVWCNEEWQIR